MAQAPHWNLGIGYVQRARQDSPCKSWIGDIYYFSGVELKDFPRSHVHVEVISLRPQRAETEGGLMPNCSPNCLNLLSSVISQSFVMVKHWQQQQQVSRSLDGVGLTFNIFGMQGSLHPYLNRLLD